MHKKKARENFPRKFAKVTLIVDGKHTQLKWNSLAAKTLYKDEHNPITGELVGSLVKKNYYSHKTKKTSLNTQVAIEADGWVCWISPTSRPAGRWNDAKQFQEHLDNFLEGN